MRRESSGYRMGSHAALTVILVLSVIGFLLAGCGSSSWTSITAKRLNSSVGSNVGSFEFDSAHDILYAAIGDRGVWRCTTPDTNPAWRHMVGGASSYTFSSIAYDQAQNILYAGAFVPGPPPGLMSTTPKVNTHSHGVWACANPDTKHAWTNTGGEVSSEDIGNLIYDPIRGVLYAATIERGAWRYKTQANH